MTAARSVLAAVCLVTALAACGSPPTPIAPGEPAPDFRLTTLEGAEMRLADLAGSPVVLNFWATWCQPCRKEFPVLRDLAERPGIAVVGVSLDEIEAERVRRFARAEDLDYPIAIGDQELFERYDGFAIPYTLLLDRDLRIAAMYRGPVEGERIERDLARLDG